MNFQERLGQWAPTLDYLESDVHGISRETERLLELARRELRTIQDLDAEVEGLAPGASARPLIVRHAAAHRLRYIARQLARARMSLVSPADKRYAAAQRVLAWLDESQDADPPWRAEPAAERPERAA